MKVLHFDSSWAFAPSGHSAYGGPPELARAEGFLSGMIPVADFSVNEIVARHVRNNPPPSLVGRFDKLRPPTRAIDHGWSHKVEASLIQPFHEWYQLRWVRSLLVKTSAENELFAALSQIDDSSWTDPLPASVIRAAAALEYVDDKRSSSAVTQSQVDETRRLLRPVVQDFQYTIGQRTRQIERLPDRTSAYMNALADFVIAEYDSFITSQLGLRDALLPGRGPLFSIVMYGLGDDGLRLVRLYQFRVGSPPGAPFGTRAQQLQIYQNIDITGVVTIVGYNLELYMLCAWDAFYWQYIVGGALGIQHWKAKNNPLGHAANCGKWQSAEPLRQLFRANMADSQFLNLIMSPRADSLSMSEAAVLFRAAIKKAAQNVNEISADSDVLFLDYESGIRRAEGAERLRQL